MLAFEKIQQTMITKDDLKKEIDHLSEADLKKVYWYLVTLKKHQSEALNLPEMKLQGRLDNQDIRAIANE